MSITFSIACQDHISPLSVDSDGDDEIKEPAPKRVKFEAADPSGAADFLDGVVKWSRIEQNRADAARPAPSMPPPPPPPPGHSIPPPPPPQTPASSSGQSDPTTQVQII